MNHIKKFNEFINENKKINEGGGAGIEFTTDCTVEAKLLVSKKDIKFVTLKVDASDGFNARGYEDGMNDVSMKLLKFLPESYQKQVIAALYKLKLAVDEDALTELGVTEEITTFEELKEKAKQDFYINIDLSFQLRDMHFGGYIRGSFSVGDTVFSENKNCEGHIKLETEDGHDYNFEYYSESLDGFTPHFQATEDFVKFYNEVFKDEGMEEYLKHEMKYLLFEEVDGSDAEDIQEYLQDYLEDNGMSLEEFKENYDKLAEKFREFLQSSRNTSSYYYESLLPRWTEHVQEKWHHKYYDQE